MAAALAVLANCLQPPPSLQGMLPAPPRPRSRPGSPAPWLPTSQQGPHKSHRVSACPFLQGPRALSFFVALIWVHLMVLQSCSSWWVQQNFRHILGAIHRRPATMLCQFCRQHTVCKDEQRKQGQ